MTGKRTKVLIVLGYDQDPVLWRERHAAGATLDVTPYGYDRAGEEFELSWAESPRESLLVRRLRNRIIRHLGYDLVHVWRNRAAIRAADVVWTHTEREHLAVALVDRGRTPVVAQSVWLWDLWPTWSGSRRRAFARLLRRHPIELTLGAANRDASRELVPGRPVEMVPFGSATIPSADVEPVDDLVVSLGNDRHRDWATLAAAARALPHLRFRVASNSREARRIDWPANVDRRAAMSRSEIEDLYRSAACVVLPLRQNLHASGATSAIEALSARRPMVVTDVGGIGDYVRGAATLVAPSDAPALADAISAAVAGDARPGPDEVRARGLRQSDYVERFAAITRALVAGTPVDPRIHEFVPVAPTD